MTRCTCTHVHESRRIALTGGPGAGKTAVLEVLQRASCEHVLVLQEAASLIFRGGFPRGSSQALRRPAQRAIYYVQRELEATALAANASIVLCDRGTVDGLAYWPGPDDMWPAVGTTLDAELARYDAVIHLRTPPDGGGYNHVNPLRIESADEAAAIDARIVTAWSQHPRRFEVPATADFLDKVRIAMRLVTAQLPPCCRPATLESWTDRAATA